jgi:thiamine-monophosphate kinase
MPSRIQDIGERGLLELFSSLVDAGDLPYNDDAVAFSINDETTMVLNIDTLVGTTDVLPAMTPLQIGSKAATMAISDLAAKGVQPQFTIASGAFPAEFEVEKTLALVQGIQKITHKHGGKFLGGDTNEGKDIVLSVVAGGLAKKKTLLKRNGAKNGDIICTTGEFGLTGAGFKVVLEDYPATEKQTQSFNQAIYEPEARVETGLLLSKSNLITSCIDSSDGLSWCLKEILREKEDKLGITIENIPIAEEVLGFAKNNNLQAEELALYAGEEFELVFTMKENSFTKVEALLHKHNRQLFKLGKITNQNPGKIILTTQSKAKTINPRGWEHFKQEK